MNWKVLSFLSDSYLDQNVVKDKKLYTNLMEKWPISLKMNITINLDMRIL